MSIQGLVAGCTGWTVKIARDILRTMDLTDDEKQAAAQACRVAAHQAEHDAEKQSNPAVRGTFEATAKQYRDVAAKLQPRNGRARPL